MKDPEGNWTPFAKRLVWAKPPFYPGKYYPRVGVSQELNNDIENLRPMHWRNNAHKLADLTQYGRAKQVCKYPF